MNAISGFSCPQLSAGLPIFIREEIVQNSREWVSEIHERIQAIAAACFKQLSAIANPRDGENLLSALTAALLSFSGIMIGGISTFNPAIDPLPGVLTGSFLGGIGNIFSTCRSWNTGEIEALEQWIEKLLKETNDLLAEQEDSQIDTLFQDLDETITLDLPESQSIERERQASQAADVENQQGEESQETTLKQTAYKVAGCLGSVCSSLTSKRYLKNYARLASVGILAFGGSAVAALPVSVSLLGLPAAVFLGALFSTISNALSTYSSWDNGSIAKLKQKLVEVDQNIEDKEKKLAQLIQEAASREEDEEDSAQGSLLERFLQLAGEIVGSCFTRRILQNILKLCLAGGASGLAIILSSYTPLVNVLGPFLAILLGGAAGGGGNFLSTRFSWTTNELKNLREQTEILQQTLNRLKSA